MDSRKIGQTDWQAIDYERRWVVDKMYLPYTCSAAAAVTDYYYLALTHPPQAHTEQKKAKPENVRRNKSGTKKQLSVGAACCAREKMECTFPNELLIRTLKIFIISGNC